MALILVSGTALASDYDHCAEALQAMGLFMGSNSGFELDRQATRAEAAVMLVRLLGAEEKAQNGEYSHPFTDVPEWASPHIAYMYETGLTKGTGAATFNPQGICDLQMYSTFILRSLGYEEDKGDFTYAAATDFAYGLGVVDIFTGSGTFLRDNMAAISYTALFAPPKGQQTTLLAQLIDQEAVTEAAAKPYLTLFDDYVQFNSASLGSSNTQQEIQFNMSINLDMGAEGDVDLKYDALIQADASAVGELSDLKDVLAALGKIKFGMANQIALSGTLLDEETDVDIKLDLYLLDGVLYLDTDLSKSMDMPLPEKMKLDLDVAAEMLTGMLDELDELDFGDLYGGILDQGLSNNIFSMLPNDIEVAYYGIAWVKTIKSTDTTDGGKRVDIDIIMSASMVKGLADLMYGGMPEEILGEINNVFDEMDFSVETSYFFDKEDNLTGLKCDIIINYGLEGVAAILTMQLEYHITKTGEEVKITLPGKSEDYMDLSELLESLL